MVEFDEDPFYRKCLYCGTEFDANHGNRKFCNKKDKPLGSRDCKITYNNLKAKKLRDITSQFNQAAAKNYMILHELFESNLQEVSGRYLEAEGFEYNKFTGFILDKVSGKRVPVYYAYKVVNIGGDKFNIEKI